MKTNDFDRDKVVPKRRETDIFSFGSVPFFIPAKVICFFIPVLKFNFRNLFIISEFAIRR